MTRDEMYRQQDRLFTLACEWFERALAAQNVGDKRTAQVARLAHDMCAAAHRNVSEALAS